MKSFTLMESGVFPKSLSSGKTLGLRGVWLRLFLFSSSVLCGLLCYVVESTRMINPLTMAVLRRKQLGSQGHWGLVSPGDSPQLPPPTPMQKTCLSILHCFDATCFKGHPGPSVLTRRDPVPSLGVGRSWHCASLPLQLFTDKMGQDWWPLLL